MKKHPSTATRKVKRNTTKDAIPTNKEKMRREKTKGEKVIQSVERPKSDEHREG
jgi:hypothetical protein